MLSPFPLKISRYATASVEVLVSFSKRLNGLSMLIIRPTYDKASSPEKCISINLSIQNLYIHCFEGQPFPAIIYQTCWKQRNWIHARSPRIF